jgi:hypothetical protein
MINKQLAKITSSFSPKNDVKIMKSLQDGYKISQLFLNELFLTSKLRDRLNHVEMCFCGSQV